MTKRLIFDLSNSERLANTEGLDLENKLFEPSYKIKLKQATYGYLRIAEPR